MVYKRHPPCAKKSAGLHTLLSTFLLIQNVTCEYLLLLRLFSHLQILSGFVEDVVRASRAHPRGSQLLSRARGPHLKRARGGDGKGVTWQPLVQSWFSV